LPATYLAQGFGYNPASQITQETRDNDAFAYTGMVTVNRAYAVNGLNQYTSAGPATFTYDANGNLTSDGTNGYTYDVENRLVMAVGGGVTANLTYDPLGRMFQVDKGTSATTTRFVYDGDNLAAEYNGSNAMTKRYYFGPGEDEPILEDTGGALNCSGTRFLHANQQGSIVALADCWGNRTNIDSYDEYGIPGSANTGRFQYTGQMWLGELGMYYYKNRIYSPTLGRFLQTDPIGYEGGVNLYAYVRGDPVNNADTSGLRGVTDGEERMAENLGISLPFYYRIYPFSDSLMGRFGANATTFPYEMDFTKSRFRPDFSSSSLTDKSLFYHELFHLFQIGYGIKSWGMQALGQVTKSVDYGWKDGRPWGQQNFEAQAEAFGNCAGSGSGCGRLEGQSISGDGATLSYKKGTFTLTRSVLGSRIPQRTSFKAPVNNDRDPQAERN
jgi:RHS repeat-associated protein